MTNDPDDLQLIQGVIRRDESAFLALYDRFSARVHALTLRILRNPVLAEEATQDTFMKLWGRAHAYMSDRGSLDVWLLTIARRTALDRLRFENRRPIIDHQDLDDGWFTQSDGAVHLLETRWRSLYFAVQSLPEEQRQVIELAYYQGLSQSEIAEFLGWPLGTVKSRMRTGMERLRSEWTDAE